jgi:hypothetical protein
MTKAELIHALHDFPLSTEIVVGLGDPVQVVPVDSWFPTVANHKAVNQPTQYVLIGHFLPPVKDKTFLCRTCRGGISKGRPDECPACKGEGRVSLENYHRW